MSSAEYIPALAQIHAAADAAMVQQPKEALKVAVIAIETKSIWGHAIERAG